ncbi:hypothetical protein PR048_031513 [Dryococelus australis]|uniref:Uncharacterized protein n=1 Tax=Dryococelus australis TaxID=614101 RepID=A0ABQ9G5H3_9NEOP|nr:hypothetical protein PR048_031513 [Dryococelus australis]
MLLVGGYPRGSPISPDLAFRRCSVLTSFQPHRLSRSHHITTITTSNSTSIISPDSTITIAVLAIITITVATSTTRSPEIPSIPLRTIRSPPTIVTINLIIIVITTYIFINSTNTPTTIPSLAASLRPSSASLPSASPLLPPTSLPPPQAVPLHHLHHYWSLIRDQAHGQPIYGCTIHNLGFAPIGINKMVAGAAVVERLARSPPTKANRVQSPAGSPDFRKWESCRTMPFLPDLPFPPSLNSGAAPYSLQSPSSVLKISLLRAAQISSLIQYGCAEQTLFDLANTFFSVHTPFYLYPSE